MAHTQITANHGYIHGWHMSRSQCSSMDHWSHMSISLPAMCVDDTGLSLPAMVYMDGTSRSLPTVEYMCLTMECIRGWHMSRWWCSYKRGSHISRSHRSRSLHEGHHVHITASHNISAYVHGWHMSTSWCSYAMDHTSRSLPAMAYKNSAYPNHCKTNPIPHGLWTL